MVRRSRLKKPTPFGVRLRLARKERGFSAIALSEMAGVSHSVVAQVESGRIQMVKAPIAHALARALDVPAEWLIGGGTPPSNLPPAA